MIPTPGIQTQGGGSVSSDQLNTYLQGATNVAQLRSFAGLNGMTVWMQGTVSFNDGGQGVFVWDSAATSSDDNGVTTIQPSGVTGAGRWLRQAIAPEGSIPLTQLANIPANTILGNNTGAPGPVLPLSVAQILSMLSLSGMTIPSGFIGEYGGLAAPAGWLICDGSAVSRTTYAALFTAIGTNFGVGDGSTTFNIPDFRGRFARGYDTSGSIDPSRVFGSTQASALQSHQHISDTPTVFVGAQTSPFGDTTVSVTRTGFSTAGSGSDHYGMTNDGTTYSGFNPNAAGQVSATETRPTNVAVSFIIKT